MTCQCTNPNHNHGACSIEEIARDQARQRLADLCDFCGKAAHLGACAELIAYTERVKAGIKERLEAPRYAHVG